MTIQNLESFLTVVQERNITKAASILHISQQALSSQLARIEEELGCQLFERHRELELTYSGKCLEKAAKQILEIDHQTKSMIADANANLRGELRIGISHTRGQAILPLILPDFSRKFPLVELTVAEGNTTELEEDLERGQIDVLIGFMPLMTESAETCLLMRERLFLIAPVALLRDRFGNETEKICTAYRETEDLKLFRDLPFVMLKPGDRIRDLVNREFNSVGISPEILIETRNIQTAFSLSAEGMGMTVCPELYLNSSYTLSGDPTSAIRKRVEIFPFPNRVGFNEIGIGYNRNRYLSRFAEAFIEMCKLKFQENRFPAF